jgi:chromosome condensin MukBEF MukE localization factor
MKAVITRMDAEFTTDHVRERFCKAVMALAITEDSLANRVETAALILMPFGDHDAERLPEEFRDSFNRLRKLYMSEVTTADARTLAEEIFSFFVRLCRWSRLSDPA